MEKIIQFLTKDENDAYKVADTLQSLNAKGDIGVAEVFVLHKAADGQVSVKDSKGSNASNTLYGSLVGGLVGLVAGPVGFLFGTSMGALIGSASDLDDADFQGAYVSEIAKNLQNNQTVVIAHVDENWVAPIDTNLSSLAEIKRYDVQEELDKLYARQERELEDRINAKRAELAQAVDDKKKDVQKEVDKLEKQLKRINTQARQSISAQKNAYRKWLGQKSEQKEG